MKLFRLLSRPPNNAGVLPQRFRATSNDIGGAVTLDFGYLLLDLARHSRETLTHEFPNSYPYLLALQSLQQLSRTAIAAFFVGSLALRARGAVKIDESGNYTVSVSAVATLAWMC